MLHFLDPLRDVTTLSVLVRMLLAVCCGGIIGIEREHKRRPAGFRTHILICLGAAITTLTSQYLALNMHYYTDIARLGAQVIAGVGFIGAGTIIVTRRRRVKGLTTAAGLWTAAIVGLAMGAGYYEAAAYTTFLILLAELVFSKLEYRMLKRLRDVCFYIEYENNEALDQVIRMLNEENMNIVDMEFTRSDNESSSHHCAVVTVETGKQFGTEKLLAQLGVLEGVVAVEEM